jgi:membrane dipeptidase
MKGGELESKGEPRPDRRDFLRLAAWGAALAPAAPALAAALAGGAGGAPDGLAGTAGAAASGPGGAGAPGAAGAPVGAGAASAVPGGVGLGGALDGAIVVNALGAMDDPNLDSDAEPAAGATPAKAAKAAREETGVDDRAVHESRAAGLTAVNVTVGYVAGPQEPFESTVSAIAVWDRLIRERAADLLKVWTAEDIRRAHREGRIGIIYGFQNAVALGDKLDRVEIFRDLGVRVIQLTYNPRNTLGDGSMVAENHGLTPFGREVVARLNEDRVMVDLSHSGERTCLDAARLSRQPISINHTGCRALADLPRNKTDEELRLVASRGGFVGIYFMPFLTLSGHAAAADVVAHIDHAVNVCGEDHVGIGTDGPVTTIDDLAAYRSLLAKEVAGRAAAGIAARGERADTLPFVIDLRGPDQFRDLARRLARRGYPTARIEKILGLNFLRFAAEVWGS